MRPLSALELLHTCREKLYNHTSNPNVALRIIVGHSNMLEALVNKVGSRSPLYSAGYCQPTGMRPGKFLNSYNIEDKNVAEIEFDVDCTTQSIAVGLHTGYPFW
jgi:hypothetical protein